MRVLICGGGVIGASIAYFLSLKGVQAIVAEKTGVANAASGKSGGFLALDWCDGGPLEGLARRSFALHAQLAKELDDDWCYRRMTTYGGVMSRQGYAAKAPISWTSPNVRLDHRLGTEQSTAQVHPALFTKALMRAAEANGAKLMSGEVSGLVRDEDGGRVTGAIVDGQTIAADAMVIAMGPWSILATRWLSLPAVYGLKGHSIVFDTGADLPADALFLDFEGARDGAHPEVFPRTDGTTYICGLSSEASVPLDPAQVVSDPGAAERLEDICRQLSPALAKAKVIASQACFRPVTVDGMPLIGQVAGAEGAYVATGHSVWGILNAPATGEAMADLIVDGAAHRVDIARFDPNRLQPFDATQLR